MRPLFLNALSGLIFLSGNFLGLLSSFPFQNSIFISYFHRVSSLKNFSLRLRSICSFVFGSFLRGEMLRSFSTKLCFKYFISNVPLSFLLVKFPILFGANPLSMFLWILLVLFSGVSIYSSSIEAGYDIILSHLVKLCFLKNGTFSFESILKRRRVLVLIGQLTSARARGWISWSIEKSRHLATLF